MSDGPPEGVPPRAELVGGPLCGIVWYPHHETVASVWADEEKSLTGHDDLDLTQMPEAVHLVGDGFICGHFRGVEYLYVWSHDDIYRHDPVDWDSSDLDPDFEYL